MKPLIILIFLLLTTCTTIGQGAQADTFLSRVSTAKLNIHSKDFQQAQKGAENYLSSLLNDTFYHSHIKINFRQTRKDDFQVCIGKSGDAKLLENHVYYNIHYFVVDKEDTLSYFELLVDSIGKPTQFDKDFSFSSPTKLILSFLKLFPNGFKIGFAKATTIVKQHGFQNKPFLNYQIEDDKDELFWRVSKKLNNGNRRVFDISVDTGETREFYFPILEQ